jgi:hypothetical protein
MKTPRVFIIQPAHTKPDGWTPDLEPANKFGRIEFIFDGGDRAYADPRAALRKLQKRLSDFNEAEDSLLAWNFGDPMCVWLLFYWMGWSGFKPYVLYWSRGRGENGAMSNEKGFYLRLSLDSVLEQLESEYEKEQKENRQEGTAHTQQQVRATD